MAGEAAGRRAAEAKAVGSQAAKVEDRQVVTAAVVARMGAKVGEVATMAAAAVMGLAGYSEADPPGSVRRCAPPVA